MRFSKDLSGISETWTAEQLVDANTDFVKGVIYKHDIHKYVTPKHTFNGWCADCFTLVRTKGNVFSYADEFAIPVRKSDLGEIVGVLIP